MTKTTTQDIVDAHIQLAKLQSQANAERGGKQLVFSAMLAVLFYMVLRIGKNPHDGSLMFAIFLAVGVFGLCILSNLFSPAKIKRQ